MVIFSRIYKCLKFTTRKLDQSAFTIRSTERHTNGKFKKKILFMSANVTTSNTVKETNRSKVESRRTMIVNVNEKKLILQKV